MSELPKYAKSLVDAGDWVGNHSYTHADLTTLSPAQVRDELTRADSAIEKATGVRPEFVRPPFSKFNDETVSVMNELNLETALWTVNSRDYEADQSVSDIVANSVKVQDQGIIVMHDTSAKTVAAVPQIVKQLKEKGLCPGKLAVAPGQTIPSPVGDFSVIAVKP